MEHSTEILYNRTRVYCSAVHRFGSDALLLARFSEPKRAWRAADLCSGCGIVSLEWHDRGHRGKKMTESGKVHSNFTLNIIAFFQETFKH